MITDKHTLEAIAKAPGRFSNYKPVGVLAEEMDKLAKKLNELDYVHVIGASGGVVHGICEIDKDQMLGGIVLEIAVQTMPALITLLNIFHASWDLKWNTDVVPFTSGYDYVDSGFVKLIVRYPYEHKSDTLDDIEFTQSVADTIVAQEKEDKS
jgi:hypothetical protein